MAGKRLTRKEIQEDQIGDALQETYSWISENRNTLLVGFGILLAVVAGAYAFQGYRQNQDARIQVEFSDALKILQAPLSGDAPTVEPGHEGHDHAPSIDLQFASAQERDQRALEAFQALAENYSGTIAEFSSFYAAVSKDRLGKSSEAESDLVKLAAGANSPEVASLSYNYLAFLGEKEGNWDLAIDSLTKLADAPSENFPRQNALYRLGRTLEVAGKRSEALEAYRKLAAEFPQDTNIREVNSRIDVLSAVLGDQGSTAEEQTESNG